MGANVKQLEDVQIKVARGDYRVDSREVAEAILDRLLARTVGRKTVNRREDDRDQTRVLIALRAA